MENVQSQFEACVKQIKEGPKMETSNEVKLGYYKLYKQAMLGDVQGS